MRKPLIPICGLIYLFGSFLEIAVAQDFTDFKREPEIVYKEVDGQQLKLVLFLPEVAPKDKPTPLMLYTHGGGWRGGNIQSIVKQSFVGTLQQLLGNGIACAAVKYRLAKGTTTGVECVEDCKDAVRFLRLNAQKYNLDDSRIGVWGGSAGGHLALMVALTSDQHFLTSNNLSQTSAKVCCAVSYYPLTTFLDWNLFKGTRFEKEESLAHVLGGVAIDRPEVAAQLSPINYLHKDMPPILLIHGDKDTIIPINQSELLYKQAKMLNAEVQFITVNGAAHSLKGKNLSPSLKEVNEIAAKFIIEQLKGAK